MMKRVLILFGLLFCAFPAHAIGLGQPLLRSHLGEPLDVRVPVLVSPGESLSQFSVSLATQQEYKQLEQILPTMYAYLRVDVDKQKPEVWIHTPYAVDDAIIDLVIKVKKGRGAFFKSMRLLLDAKDIKPTHMPSWVKQAGNQVTHHAVAPTKVATPVVADVADVQYDGGWARRNRYGPVRSGDSLSEIAYRLRKDKRYSNRQVMLALFDANPDAFVNHDINRLRQGSFLNVPNDAAMQAFISSQRYQALKSQLQRSMARQQTQASKKVEKQPQQKKTEAKRFHGRVSLGLSESLLQADINRKILSRLDALEPMYQNAMASNLRMDGLDDKVDKLAEHVRSLHQKIDALAKRQAGMVKQEASYGWWWFFGLVLLNVILLAVYLYYRQMKAWQNKLVEARQTMPEAHQADVSSTPLVHPMHDDTPPFEQVLQPAQEAGQDLPRHAQQEDDVADMVAQSDTNTGNAPCHGDHEDTISLFEEMVHKKDWVMAERYYERLSEKEKERPRIQALWVQALHGTGKIIERNVTLLHLSKIYEYEKWYHFCSFFDKDVWRELQDEKVISFTGKVVETEVDRLNQQYMHDDGKDEQQEASLAEEAAQGAWEQDEQADTIIDMGRVDDGDVEPLLDIVVDEVSSDVEERVESEQTNGLMNDKGDTVLVSAGRMKAFRQTLELDDDEPERNADL